MTDIQPGFLVLHGNRAELLAEAVFEWLRRQPLQPLEEEVFLVQSNGVAEWLKMTLATADGICAATRVELPGRFLWRTCRQVLGAEAVPALSALDKLPMTWRLMHCLPGLLDRPGFEPLAGFLRRGDMARRLQLAERLADLYDQYQVYRADWLDAWAAGHDVLPRGPDETPATASPLPAEQRWQAALWRELLAPLGDEDRAATRPQLQRRLLAALAGRAGRAGHAPGTAPRLPLARRVVLFGMTHVPMQTLQTLAALSAHSQVLLAIPNPCRYHWADIIQGRELLSLERRRQPHRAGRDLASVPLEDMHAHAHPLLAAWGRQGRDFVRQLDAFDDVLLARQRFPLARVDLFDDGPGDTLLRQVQAHIRDLQPLAEHPAGWGEQADPADRSIVFHIAHSVQREVEILHDQLLELLAQPASATPGAAVLNPRDVVVMVPDIAVFAPAIRSVFGPWARSDPRFIPFDITDLQERGHNPLLVALEWLLRLPQQRCALSELRDLLDVPALAARFGLQADDLPQLASWMAGAGMRWGIGQAQRDGLGLAACGEQNSWLFGLRRLLLGYASGDSGAFLGIEPYDEVGGLDAALAGSLAALVEALQHWATLATTPATPDEWGGRARALLESLFAPAADAERQTVEALQSALRDWLLACETAGFDEPVTLAVAREAWLTAVDAPGLNRRFRAGGVTFCTLLPMRAIPFEVVCLLGMNDGDYPRRASRSDFDLMGEPGQARPGDRSRRDDDRQLMLEALLSARRVLYISWAGRSVRDQSEQPPSVLVSQLRDHLAAGWAGDVVGPRTTAHPLQPFSRRYFEEPEEPVKEQGGKRPPPLFTHAREWRVAHATAAEGGLPDQAPPPPFVPDPAVPLTIAVLTRFLRNPVREFLRTRLGVVFDERDDDAEDEEPFALDALQEYGLIDEVLSSLLPGDPGSTRAVTPAGSFAEQVRARLERVRRAGRLPMAELGQRSESKLAGVLVPLLTRWADLLARHPQPLPREPLRFEHGDVLLVDWQDGHRATSGEPGMLDAAVPGVWLALTASRLCGKGKKKAVRPEKLLGAWVRTLVTSAVGCPVSGVTVGRDATVSVAPMEPAEAADALAALLQAWRDGMNAPLPLALRTALGRVAGTDDLAPIFEGGLYLRGEVEDPALSRVYPDIEALFADGRFDALAGSLAGPLARWAADAVISDVQDEGGSDD